MLNFSVSQHRINIELRNKLSVGSPKELLKLSIDNSLVSQEDLLCSFDSTDISDHDEQLFDGTFQLTKDLTVDGEAALELQKLYLSWESEKLDRKQVSYTLPCNRDENKSNGVALYNPYFLAIANKCSRERSFDLLGFGQYLSEKEMHFLHQYCAFHPAIKRFLTAKDKACLVDGRSIIPCNIFEMVVENGLAHIEGYRDHLRFQKLFEARSIESFDDLSEFDDEDEELGDIVDLKFLIEYDHVLDSPSIWSENLDFYSKTSSGGQLDLLNMPF